MSDKHIIAQHQRVAGIRVINFPDLIAVETNIVAVLVGRRSLATLRVSVISIRVIAGLTTSKSVTDPQRVILILLNIHAKVDFSFIRNWRTVLATHSRNGIEFRRNKHFKTILSVLR